MAKSRAMVRRIYVARPRRRSRASGFTVPVAVLAGFAPLVSEVVSNASKHPQPFSEAGRILALRLTGWNKDANAWQPSYMLQGWAPIVAGILVHKFIGGKLGVNKALGRAGVPFIRI